MKWYQHLSPLGDSQKRRLNTPEGLRGKLRPTENSWSERSVKIRKNCFKQTWLLIGFGLVVVNLCWLRVWVHLKVQRLLLRQHLLRCFPGSLESVCFNRGNEHDFVKMRLGGQDVLVWKPDSIIDDQSLQELDLEQGFKGMQEEVRNLEHCKTGRIITQSELDDMKKAVPNLRLFQSRWVAAYKSSERVRTRIVAKDFNRGSSARSLGFSSSTVLPLRSKVFIWCLQWQRHGGCFCVHWT